MRQSLKRWFLLFAGLQALVGCSLVDEDLTDCETEYQLDYELQLVTNITTELETELSLETDVAVATALRAYLSKVFTDHAHDVDLSFYSVEGEKNRLHHERHIMDANQTSPGSRLQQEVADTLRPHRLGVFTARSHMDVQEGKDQEFKVSLYMANSAASLVLDTLGSHVKDIRVYATGFATAFDVADSLYRYQYSPVFAADKVAVDEPGAQMCFATVNFPSRTDETKAEEQEKTYWEFHVYSTLPSGSITETKLSVTHPLLPAQLEILKAKVYGNGALEPEDVTVGVSVNINWKPGMDHEVEM